MDDEAAVVDHLAAILDCVEAGVVHHLAALEALTGEEDPALLLHLNGSLEAREDVLTHLRLLVGLVAAGQPPRGRRALPPPAARIAA